MNSINKVTEIDLLTEIHKLEVRIVVLEAQVAALMDREFPPIGLESEPQESD